MVNTRYCRICHGDRIDIILDAGLQPLSNRYVKDPSETQYVHPFVMGQCTKCGVIQLLHPVPADEIACRFSWVKYTEPEEHLDSLSRTISDLPGFSEGATVCGLTYKDDTLLERLGKNGNINTWRIDPQADLGLQTIVAAGETVLPRLNIDMADRLAKKYGKAEVIVCRHIYEHTADVHGLFESLDTLLKPGGWIVFEVPDCTASLESKDYTMPWEEHLLYFTEATLRTSFSYAPFKLMDLIRYPYPVEDALVAIARSRQGADINPISPALMGTEILRAKEYGLAFDVRRKIIRQHLEEMRQRHGKIAAYGAGHQTSMFINLMGLKDFIACVMDDNSHKQGYYMPGSALPIVDSSVLMQHDIALCLLGINMIHEEKVVAKNRMFSDLGGRFISIFPASKRCFNFNV